MMPTLVRRERPIRLRRFGHYMAYTDADDASIRYRGVVGTVRRAYYAKGAEYPPSGAAAGATTAGEAAAIKATSAMRGPKGIDLGKLVDRQLDSAARTMTNTGWSVLQYLARVRMDPKCHSKVPQNYTAAAAAPGYVVGHEKKESKESTILLHRRTISVLQYLVKMGWHPLACQVPVCCTEGRKATEIDMVCFEIATGKLILLEHKEGFSAHYRTGTRGLGEPFHAQVDSLHNRHQLQHMLATLLFHRTFGLPVDRTHSAIVRVDNDRVEHIPLEAWVLAGASDMTERFMTARVKRKRTRGAAAVAAAAEIHVADGKRARRKGSTKKKTKQTKNKKPSMKKKKKGNRSKKAVQLRPRRRRASFSVPAAASGVVAL